MVLFRRVKSLGRQNSHGNGFGKTAGGGQGRFGGLGLLLLLGIMIKDGRAILGAAIHELAAGVGGVDAPPVEVQQLAIRNFLGVEFYLHRLVMAGRTGTDFLVGGIGLMAAGIAGSYFDNASVLGKIRFATPETATGKGGGLQTGRVFHGG